MPKAKQTAKKVTKKEQSLTIPVVGISGKSKGTVTLSKEHFSAPVNAQLLAQVVHTYRLRKRQGTVASKTRGQVAGSTRKIYRQKGTGRARHGAKKAPIFVGGGIAHGPKNRTRLVLLTEHMRRKALFGALTSKIGKKVVTFVDGLEEIKPKTKAFVSMLDAIGVNTTGKESLLVVPSKSLDVLMRAGGNVPYVTIVPAPLLNAYEILRHKNLLIAKDALDVLENTFGEKKK